MADLADTPPAQQPDIAAIVKAAVGEAVKAFEARLPKPPVVPPPAAVHAHATPAADPRLAAVLEALGLEDADEAILLAPQFRDKFSKARDKVADPEKRALALEQQRLRAEVAQMKAETVERERRSVMDRSMAEAGSLAAKHNVRNAGHLIAAARADGRLAIGEDGALYVANGDGKTPSGEALDKFIPDYLGKNPHLAAPPQAGGPHIASSVPGVGHAVQPTKEWTSAEIAADNIGYMQHLSRTDPVWKQAVQSRIRPSERPDGN